MVNRAALLLRYNEPAVQWINAVDPNPDAELVTLQGVNRERTVYLISDRAAETTPSVNRWVRKNYLYLFEAELEGWYTAEELWPKQRTWKLFKQWFDVECHTILIDMVGGGLYDDESL